MAPQTPLPYTRDIADLAILGLDPLTIPARPSSDLIEGSLGDGSSRFLAFQLASAAKLTWGDTSCATIARVMGHADDAELLILRLKRTSN